MIYNQFQTGEYLSYLHYLTFLHFQPMVVHRSTHKISDNTISRHEL